MTDRPRWLARHVRLAGVYAEVSGERPAVGEWQEARRMVLPECCVRVEADREEPDGQQKLEMT